VRKALHLERMFENLERRSKERALVVQIAKLVTDKDLTAENFQDEEQLKAVAEKIKANLASDNLNFRVEHDSDATWRVFFFHVRNGATPPTVLDLTLFHSGELREIRRLGAELEVYKSPFAIQSGDEKRTVVSLKAVADAVLEAGQKGVEIQRYKGLGEMNPDQLWSTTMNPEARSMLRVEIASQEEAEEIFAKLMGDQVEPRRMFIEENALNVKNLDI
jgi:DNA gyrase subunit B